MSDEESSFVILNSYDSMDTPHTPTRQLPNGSITKELLDSQLTISAFSNCNGFNHNGEAASMNIKNENELDGSITSDCLSNSVKMAPNKPPLNDKPDGTPPISMKASMNSNSGSEKSLAADFIMGDVGSDVLKNSVYSQFPSMCSVASAEEVVKLNNILSKYMVLKNTISDTNVTMKQFYEQTQSWKQEVQTMEEERKAEIAKLRNENLELRRDLENKVEQLNINEDARRKEHEDFVRNLSEKTAQIDNMSAQIQKLEQHQLASFEYISKTNNDSPNSKDATEYVTSLEHERIVKKFERQMSVIVAENFELKDMQKQYIDEINCLKVNLIAAEELHKKTQADIGFLKASDNEKNELFLQLQNENKGLKEEMGVLRTQLDIYSRDFRLEQEGKENLAHEKNQLLSDLRDLQKKNQELIQEAQRNYEQSTTINATATGALPKTRPVPAVRTVEKSPTREPKPNTIYSPANFTCPLCGMQFRTLSVLQNHVNQCLDGN